MPGPRPQPAIGVGEHVQAFLRRDAREEADREDVGRSRGRGRGV